MFVAPAKAVFVTAKILSKELRVISNLATMTAISMEYVIMVLVNVNTVSTVKVANIEE